MKCVQVSLGEHIEIETSDGQKSDVRRLHVYDWLFVSHWGLRSQRSDGQTSDGQTSDNSLIWLSHTASYSCKKELRFEN